MALLLRASRQLAHKTRPLIWAVSNQSRKGLATAAPQGAEDDDIIKQAFLSQQAKFRTMLDELKKAEIPLDPDNDQAMEDFTARIKDLKARVGLPTELENMDTLLEDAAEDAKDLRSFLNESIKIRESFGVEGVGLEAELLKEVDRVEQELGRPVKLGDDEALAAMQDKINALEQEYLPDEWDGLTMDDIDQEVEVSITRENIRRIRDAAEAKMDTIKKRDGLEWVDIPAEQLGKAPEGV